MLASTSSKLHYAASSTERTDGHCVLKACASTWSWWLKRQAPHQLWVMRSSPDEIRNTASPFTPGHIAASGQRRNIPNEEQVFKLSSPMRNIPQLQGSISQMAFGKGMGNTLPNHSTGYDDDWTLISLNDTRRSKGKVSRTGEEFFPCEETLNDNAGMNGNDQTTGSQSDDEEAVEFDTYGAITSGGRVQLRSIIISPSNKLAALNAVMHSLLAEFCTALDALRLLLDNANKHIFVAGCGVWACLQVRTTGAASGASSVVRSCIDAMRMYKHILSKSLEQVKIASRQVFLKVELQIRLLGTVVHGIVERVGGIMLEDAGILMESVWGKLFRITARRLRLLIITMLACLVLVETPRSSKSEIPGTGHDGSFHIYAITQTSKLGAVALVYLTSAALGRFLNLSVMTAVAAIVLAMMAAHCSQMVSASNSATRTMMERMTMESATTRALLEEMVEQSVTKVWDPAIDGRMSGDAVENHLWNGWQWWT